MSNSGDWDFSEFSGSGAQSGSAQGASNPFGGSAQQQGGFGGQGGQFGPGGQNLQGGANGSPFGGQNPFGGGPAASGAPNPFGGAPTPNAFGGSAAALGAPASGGPLIASKAPVWIIYTAMALAVIAAILAVIFADNPFVTISAWVVAGPVAILGFSAYQFQDTKLRSELMYSPPTWAPWLYRIGIVVAFIAVIVCSLMIAFWVGRL